MKRFFSTGLIFVAMALLVRADDAQPLRVFIRGGPKTHGPGQHDGPRFLADYQQLLKERGAVVQGKIGFPTRAELENTDVMVMYTAEGGTINAEDRVNLDAFQKRGGGIVVIHDSICGTDPQWFKTIVGGAWEHGHSKWQEGDVGLYFVDQQHPITEGISNFEFEDEVYWDLHMMPDAHILAASFQSVFNIAPQMWVYEKENHRAFVCIPGHQTSSFSLPHFRAIILRGIAWAGKREANLLVSKEEIASLKYPAGGPTAPEKAAEKITVHPDFKLSLVAAEPLIEKPISMDWDDQGRLWVAETPEYPNGRRINKNDEMIAPWREKDPLNFQGDFEKRPAHDRISILTDTDGDGRMDKKTVFYEGLELVTSMVPYKDGVIVSQAPDIYWIHGPVGGTVVKDVLFTGFGTFDTHAVISNMRWGMDGWVYATEGYSGANPKTPDGKKEFGKFGAGVLRFRPDGSAIEMVSSKGGNTWGMDFSWDNEMFFTQANGTHLQHVVLPEAILAKGRVGSTPSYKTIEDHRKVYPIIDHKKQPYVQIDNVGGFTAASGSAVYTGGAWPEKYLNTHFVSEPTVNLVHLDWLKRDGPTYVASKDRDEEWIASTDLWFRPIHQRVGPDGAMYILDFYNQAAVHNDTRGPKHGANNAAVRPDRDHHLGRIWRVQYKDPTPLPVASFTDDASLLRALEHPNGWVRMTAHRLLSEKGQAVSPETVAGLKTIARSGHTSAGRLQALWVLNNIGQIDSALLVASCEAQDPAVRKNALLIAALHPSAGVTSALRAAINDKDSRAQLAALSSLSSQPLDSDGARELVALYPTLNDPWTQSAVLAVAANAPLVVLEAVFADSSGTGSAGKLQPLAVAVTQQIANRQDARLAAETVTMAAKQNERSADLKRVVMDELSRTLKPELVPPWSRELEDAFNSLLAGSGTAASVMPLIASWDTGKRLADRVKPAIQALLARLENEQTSAEDRLGLVANLIGVRKIDAGIVPAFGALLRSEAAPALKRRVLEALGGTSEAEPGVELVNSFAKITPELRDPAFAQIIKRPEWTLDLLEALRKQTIDPATLGPLAIHRLRAHSDPEVARKANEVIDALRGPEVKEKDELIAKFTPPVLQPGSSEAGHKIFTQNCSVCHSFKGEGKDIAPDLTGMGAHGAAELLIHILDPNRLVEPNYIAQSIETKDDQVIDGVVARENANSILIRNALGDIEIKKSNIKTQRSTGLSLMPNGFEALGGEGLRDLLAFICEGESRFRLVDLGNAATADSSRGVFQSIENPNDTLQFKKFGLFKVGDVPFQVTNPVKSQNGKNLVVLKGGNGYSKTLPQSVKIKGGFAANRLHFLGGVGGWAYPCCGDNKLEHEPVAKVTVFYADGDKEELVLKNGEEFADYNGHADVPGSKAAPDLLKAGQVRVFSKALKHTGQVASIELASFDNAVAPLFAAITAESAEPGAKPVQEAAASQPALRWDKGIKTLIVGGGSSHDFGKWFDKADTEILSQGGANSVVYTDDTKMISGALKQIDVLYLSNNKPISDPAARSGIFDFHKAGKGLLLVHPALWYNWADWPEYNQKLAGGGAKSHESYAEFEVTVDDARHPIMTGVPATFRVRDELYRFQKDTNGPAIHVLATGKSLSTGASYPVAWTVETPEKGRVVCLTLGHDGGSHDTPAYHAILRNALQWLAQP